MTVSVAPRHVIPIAACALGIVLLFAGLLRLGGQGWQLHDTIAIALVLPGFGLWATARLQLGNAFTARAEARTLITDGVYAHVRHPVYTGGLVVIAGLFMFIGQPLLFIVLPLLGWNQRRRALREEIVLEDRFGDAYREYRARTW